MEWMGLNQIREQFLSFFESKGHVRLDSFPLVPQDDNSLLLINSGMAPLKKYFLGQATPPGKRVTTCQKCIRTPDIERVGKTSRHGTYFEMLGNFSFGDYFKHEATKWAWEFITEVLKIPIDRLWVSFFETDDETFDIWTKEVGVSPDRMVRLGREDNFWEIGSGPCGPCSEIYFDRGEQYGCGSPSCAVGCDCDRYVEFWNLVFSQFNSDGQGHYEPMEHPNIDTGMGLERLACIMQGVDNLFEVDTVQNIMKHIGRIAGISYKEDERNDVSLRVITDHIRSTTFMVADGVIPSNEGRGYVLRRLLRRAARHGKLIGIKKPFLYEVVDTVINENRSAYPELVDKAGYIKKVILNEEESFSKTIDKGMELLAQLIDKYDNQTAENGGKILPGDQAFKLYDTYGFPLDLTREIIAERGMSVDEESFMRLMDEQREKARKAREKNEHVGWVDEAFEGISDITTEFVGYQTTQCQAAVAAIIKDGALVDSTYQDEDVTVILNVTPFYAESGGQVADTGSLLGGTSEITITDCKKTSGGQIVHIGRVKSGLLRTGETVTAIVDSDRRNAIMRNHTCAHLLQAALRNVLGDHVHQAGQLVDEHRLRFDFSHFSAMTRQEIERVEYEVNQKILEGIDVVIQEMPINEAKKLGAMALFSEKYSDIVRVVSVGDYSKEFCGGTHVTNTAKIGLFKIVSESSVAAGVRRIEAATGNNVLQLLSDANHIIARVAELLKLTNTADVVTKVSSLSEEIKHKDREIEALNQKLADVEISSLIKKAVEVKGLRVICSRFSDTKPDNLRMMCDRIKEIAPDAVAVLATVSDDKGTLCACCGKQALERGAHAGTVVKQVAALTGGSGGGRPDNAMAGVRELAKLDAVLAAVPEMISSMLK